MSINVFKKIIGGEFPKGSIILISGEPGTGKTIFVSSYAQEELRRGNKVLYICFNETKDEYFTNIKKIGIDLEDNKFRFLDFFLTSNEAIKVQLKLILEEINKFQPNLLIIDSITPILSLIESKKIRGFIRTSLGTYTKSMKITTILVSERAESSSTIEFAVDGVILLKCEKYGEYYRRVMEIPKMRGVKISKPQYEFAITEKGIVIFEVPKLEIKQDSSFERISTGIRELDQLLEGGYYVGSTTFIVGHTGTGKTTFGLHFVYENCLKGRKAVFISFDEGRGGVLKAMKNYGMSYDKVKENLMLLDYIPEASSPVSIFIDLIENIDRLDPDLIYIDSLTSIRKMEEKEMKKMIRYLQIITKERGITLCISTNAIGDLSEIPLTEICTMADNIILLWNEMSKNEIIRHLLVLKSRATNNSRKIYRYKITERGIKIEGRADEEKL